MHTHTLKVTYYSRFSAPSSFPRNLHLETISHIELLHSLRELPTISLRDLSSIGHGGCFQSVAVINNAAINNSAYRSFFHI